MVPLPNGLNPGWARSTPSSRLGALQSIHCYISIILQSTYVRSPSCLPNTVCNNMHLGWVSTAAQQVNTKQLARSIQ